MLAEGAEETAAQLRGQRKRRGHRPRRAVARDEHGAFGPAVRMYPVEQHSALPGRLADLRRRHGRRSGQDERARPSLEVPVAEEAEAVMPRFAEELEIALEDADVQDDGVQVDPPSVRRIAEIV